MGVSYRAYAYLLGSSTKFQTRAVAPNRICVLTFFYAISLAISAKRGAKVSARANITLPIFITFPDTINL